MFETFTEAVESIVVEKKDFEKREEPIKKAFFGLFGKLGFFDPWIPVKKILIQASSKRMVSLVEMSMEEITPAFTEKDDFDDQDIQY